MVGKQPKYGHQVANLHDASRGWRAAAYSLGVVALALAVLAGHLADTIRVVLVPPQFARLAQGRVPVTRGKAYLALLARADTATLLDWTPATVGSQFTAFLDRCAPTLYARLDTQMLADSKEYTSYNLTESFYVRKVVFVPPAAIDITGWLDRYSGDKRVMHALLTYRLTYNHSFALTRLTVERDKHA